MNIKKLDLIYNEQHLVIVPLIDQELFESFKYSFKNVILIKDAISDLPRITNFINKNNFKQIVLVNYQVEYEELIEKIPSDKKIHFIFTEALASFSDKFIYQKFKNICKIHDKVENSKLGIIDKNLYECLKDKEKNIYLIQLDIETSENADVKYDNTIGILNNQKKNTHSFYNELSAIKLVPNNIAKVQKPNNITKKFLKLFDIPYKVSNDEKNILMNNLANLYVNFTENNNSIFLKSMDRNVPCIMGNNCILDDYKYLKEMLILESDDDINEIANKIVAVEKNRDKILNEYQKFRKEYSNKCKNLIEIFLEEESKIKKEKSDEENILLSVIVPVYNTEKYLEKCLSSILAAKISNMEIIVINDGSTDNSEEKILKFQKKHPNLIRYVKQENHGLGNVRNVGLKEAKGKYIASVDSDDTININFFIDALKYMANDVDLIIYDWLTITDETQYETAALDYVFKDINRYEGLLYTSIMPSTCNKIIKKRLFTELDIKYIEDKFEDLSTNPFIMLNAKIIKYINKPYYEYYIRSNSIMRTKPGYSMIDILNIVNKRTEKYKNYINVDIDKFKYYTFAWRIEEYIINQLYTIDEKEIKEFAKYLEKNFKEVFEYIFNNKYYIEKINSLPLEKRSYIESRNNAIKNNELEKFIKKARKEKNYYVLTPPIMYYGESQKGEK